MVTAILPIRTGDNTFWTSDTGLACIERFLKMFDEAACIDQVFVITRESQVHELANTYDIKALDLTIPGTIDRPYTFEQTLELARQFKKNCPASNEDIVIADHRNLYFNLEDLKKAHSIFYQNPHDALVSLAFCRDHPCQYKSYFTFMGTGIFNCKDVDSKKSEKGRNDHCISRSYTSSLDKNGEITVTIHFKNTDCAISVDNPVNGLVAHILPFTAHGPMYEKFLEIYISDSDFKPLPTLSSDSIEGVIVTLLGADYSGVYDVIECFTPEHADWELNPSDNMVYDKENQHLIQGRQQFSLIYTYDGSLCVIPATCLNHDAKLKWTPFPLNKSCIVSDWIDFYSIKQ